MPTFQTNEPYCCPCSRTIPRDRLRWLWTVLLFIAPGLVHSAELSPEADKVLHQVRGALVQVQVNDTSTGAKACTGTGFRVLPAGSVVTNYHVVSPFVEFPKLHRICCIAPDKTEIPATLIDIDVVHDLALLKVANPPPDTISLLDRPAEKGARIFALGFPFELGLTVVEGLYNDVVKESLHGRIHFAGSLNSGMSGGPAVNVSGQVMGVNVWSRGNQASLLVPVDFVKTLIDRKQRPSVGEPADFQKKACQQLLEHQGRYIGEILSRPLPTVELGGYRVPGKLAPYLKCWGSSSHERGNLFQTSHYSCHMENEEFLFLSNDQITGFLKFSHFLITSRQLDRIRLYKRCQAAFKSGYPSIQAGRDDVTSFDCQTRFVTSKGLTFKVVLCLRAYKQHLGLYDAVFRAASLNENDTALVTTLVMAGVSYSNAVDLAQRYLESIQWKK